MNYENLAALLDSLEETGVYVIEQQTHRILYYNKKVKEESPHLSVGMVCHEVWQEACEDCPLLTISDKQFNHTIRNNDPFGEVLDIMANRIVWDGIPAFVIVVTPHKLDFEEQQHWVMQIKEIYAQSLVTVFHECLIINLVEDYYVTCQIGGMGLELSDRAPFAAMSQDYFEHIIHPDELGSFLDCFSKQAMNLMYDIGKEQVIRRFRRLSEDGTYHMVEFMATRVEQYGMSDDWCVLVSRDVNEEYLQEQQKNVEISQLATALRVAYQRLFTINLTQNTYNILEPGPYSLEDIPESGTFDSFVEKDILFIDPMFLEEYRKKIFRQAMLDAFVGGDQMVSMELRRRNKEEAYQWYSIQVVRVQNSYTGDILAVFMSKSIEEERRQQEENLEKERKTKLLLEEALQKATNASQTKGDFLSRVSHDIRTPLNAIIGMTTLAQAFPEDAGKLGGYLKNIKLSGEHLLGLINDVLDMSKIENGETDLTDAEFHIDKLVQDVVVLVRPKIQEKEQNLEVEIDSRIHTLVSGDEQRLRQVLVNILDNASKYTQKQGNIKFLAEGKKGGNGMLGTYQFVIEDNGLGMKQEFLDRIFEPFVRADDTRLNKIAGSGLGMTIVQNIVNMMDGDIRVESEFGKGSRFTITLCLEQRLEEKGAEEEQAVEYGDFSHMRVLVAEDNEMNQQIMEEMIGLVGPEVDIVENGQKAIEAIVSHPAQYYDLVFMDIRMPVMGGYEAAREIRKLGTKAAKDIPIIALTADAFKDDAKKAKLAGMSGHIGKPITMEKLKEALEYYRKWGAKRRSIPFYGESGE